MNIFFENANEKGFHRDDTFGQDGTPDARTRIMRAALILTEWREQVIDSVSPDPKWWISNNGKPCGELSEWADVWIRCADTLGSCDEPLAGCEFDVQSEIVKIREPYVPTAVAIAVEFARSGDHDGYASVLRSIATYAIWRMSSLGLPGELPPPAEAIRIKHAYNTTRPSMHGKLA